MANNEYLYCNVCLEETLFFLQSDLLWYCDKCDCVLGTKINLNEDYFYEFENENEESILCPSCKNYIYLEDIINDGICHICLYQLEDELEEKNYYYSQEEEIYLKNIE